MKKNLMLLFIILCFILAGCDFQQQEIESETPGVQAHVSENLQYIEETESSHYLQAEHMLLVYVHGEETKNDSRIVWEKLYIQLEDIPQAENINAQIRQETDQIVRQLLEDAKQYEGKTVKEILISVLGYDVLYQNDQYLALAFSIVYSPSQSGRHEGLAENQVERYVLTFDLSTGEQIAWENKTSNGKLGEGLVSLLLQEAEKNNLKAIYPDIEEAIKEENLPYYFNEEGMVFYLHKEWDTRGLNRIDDLWGVGIRSINIKPYDDSIIISYEELEDQIKDGTVVRMGKGAGEITAEESIVNSILAWEHDAESVHIKGMTNSGIYPFVTWETGYTNLADILNKERINEQIQEELKSLRKELIELGGQYLAKEEGDWVEVQDYSEVLYQSDSYVAVAIGAKFTPNGRLIPSIEKKWILTYELETGAKVKWEDRIDEPCTETNLKRLLEYGYQELMEQESELYTEESLEEYYTRMLEEAYSWYAETEQEGYDIYKVYGLNKEDYAKIPLEEYIPYYFNEYGVVFYFQYDWYSSWSVYYGHGNGGTPSRYVHTSDETFLKEGDLMAEDLGVSQIPDTLTITIPYDEISHILP